MDYEDSLVIRTVRYYYIESMTQQKISEKLGISRMKAIKLLEKAKQTGVIQSKVPPERSQRLMIERRLITQWNLEGIFVVPTPPNGSSLNEVIARTAAMYIRDHLTESMFTNMGYGDTPSRVLNHLATTAEPPISVVSLTGEVSYYLPNIHSNVFNVKLYLYPAPLLVSSKEMCKATRNEPPIEEVTRMVRLITMTVVGIGAMNDDATIISDGILNQNDFLYLSVQGATSDILAHFTGKDEKPVHSDVEERLFSAPLGTLKSLDNVIGISDDPQEVEAIRAALKGGYPDILIADEETTTQLIDSS